MKRILIVDDESLILSALSKALLSICPEVKTAMSGAEAINEINSFFYDLCFLDIYLPDVSGIEVMKRINDISPETKIVIMTAYEISDDIKAAIEDGAYLFIGKPFELLQIKEIATSILNH